MSQHEEIKLFETNLVRTYWDDEQEKWYFCINDVIAVLTESKDPAGYVKKLKQRDVELAAFMGGTNCTPHQFISTDGKRHNPLCADVQTLFRIIQSVPSKKAEPIKQWLAAVGAERLRQMQDPERGIQMSLEDYKRLGMPDAWINQRLKSIEIRKDYTDQLDAHGVKEESDYARLTNLIYKTWSGLSSKEYKQLKGLHQENLRDNMTNEELVMTMLAELTATNITKNEHPQTMSEHAQVAVRGGSVANVAKQAFEQQTGKPIVTAHNAKDYVNELQEKIEFTQIEEGEQKG